MKKIKVLFALICIALMATMTPLTSHAEDFSVGIEVAPSVINLGSASPWVTVHTDITYDAVDSVSLNLYMDESDELPSASISPTLCFADERGDFVAKFDMKAVRTFINVTDKGRDSGKYIGFELTGQTASESAENFSGRQEVLVFNNNKK